MDVRAARQAGSAAARSVAPIPRVAAVASEPQPTVKRAEGTVSFDASAVVVARTGSMSRASPTPEARPTATPAAPMSELSARSSSQTSLGRSPIARITPTCQMRASNTAERRLKTMRNAARRTSRLTPCNMTCTDRMMR